MGTDASSDEYASERANARVRVGATSEPTKCKFISRSEAAC